MGNSSPLLGGAGVAVTGFAVLVMLATMGGFVIPLSGGSVG